MRKHKPLSQGMWKLRGINDFLQGKVKGRGGARKKEKINGNQEYNE